jgi:hypothetical protein
VVDGVEKEDEDVVFGDFSEEEEEIDIDVYLRLQGVV